MTEQNLDNAEIGDQKCKIDSYSQQEDQTNEEQEEDYTAQCYQYDHDPYSIFQIFIRLLEEIRNDLVQSGQTGPRAMIIGETDSGKSTLSKILFNEAVKIGRKPIFVDLDPGQDPYPPFNNPLIYFIGSVDIISNYKRLIQMMHSMIDDIERIQDMNKDIRDSGIIINTCGWVQGLGFELQKKTAQLFKCDVIINLSDDALQDQLRTSLLIDSMTNENVQNSTAPKEGSSKDLFPSTPPLISQQTSNQSNTSSNIQHEQLQSSSQQSTPISSSFLSQSTQQLNVNLEHTVLEQKSFFQSSIQLQHQTNSSSSSSQQQQQLNNFDVENIHFIKIPKSNKVVVRSREIRKQLRNNRAHQAIFRNRVQLQQQQQTQYKYQNINQQQQYQNQNQYYQYQQQPSNYTKVNISDVVVVQVSSRMIAQIKEQRLIQSQRQHHQQQRYAYNNDNSMFSYYSSKDKSKEKVNEDKMNQLIDEQQNEQKKDSEEGKKISIVDKEIELEVKKEMNDKQESIIEKDKDNEKKEGIQQEKVSDQLYLEEPEENQILILQSVELKQLENRYVVLLNSNINSQDHNQQQTSKSTVQQSQSSKHQSSSKSQLLQLTTTQLNQLSLRPVQGFGLVNYVDLWSNSISLYISDHSISSFKFDIIMVGELVNN